jgi:hypothetical protein
MPSAFQPISASPNCDIAAAARNACQEAPSAKARDVRPGSPYQRDTAASARTSVSPPGNPRSIMTSGEAEGPAHAGAENSCAPASVTSKGEMPSIARTRTRELMAHGPRP